MNIQDIKKLLAEDITQYKSKLKANQEELLQLKDEESIFISALSIEELEQKINKAVTLSPDKYPLLGIPFAVKDNIDTKGFDTTGGCEDYRYTPNSSAFAVDLLEKAGAICIGKTNLDQFATGLVGVRSPYGVAKNIYNNDYVPGGSSSGSASAVAKGYAAFSLGTDTAGSGRVPACFQNLVGIKPTKGVVSTTGVIPACKSLDCVSIFTNSLHDAEIILELMSCDDEKDAYSRQVEHPNTPTSHHIAIPLKANLKFFGNKNYEAAFSTFVENLKKEGYQVSEVDFTPLFDAAKLLYEGPWVAERFHAVGKFIETHKESVLETTQAIILGGKHPSASSYFDAEYKLKAFKKIFDNYAKQYTAFVMPTAGTIYSKAEMEEEPIRYNSNLGYYTNFMNLLDCAAIALPVAITEGNLPFGVTAFAPAFHDKALLSLAKEFKYRGILTLEPQKINTIDIAVCGAHKRGGSLNFQLTEIAAQYKSTVMTKDCYRFFALENLTPVRPGLIRDETNGAAIEVEIWKIPADKLGGFINNIQAPLGFGKVTLENGEDITSFICENYAVKGAKEITHLIRWENYLNQQ